MTKPKPKEPSKPNLDPEDIELAKRIFAIQHGEFLAFDLTGLIKELLHDKAKQLQITTNEIEQKAFMPQLYHNMLELAGVLTANVKNGSLALLHKNTTPPPITLDEFKRMDVTKVMARSSGIELEYEPEVGSPEPMPVN